MLTSEVEGNSISLLELFLDCLLPGPALLDVRDEVDCNECLDPD